MSDVISVLSLVVALLAVFVGPVVGARSERMKFDAERRRGWEIELRLKLAEFLSTTVHYFAAGYEDREDAEYLHVTHLQYELELLLDPAIPEHAELISAIETVHYSLGRGGVAEEELIRAHKRASGLARKVLTPGPGAELSRK